MPVLYVTSFDGIYPRTAPSRLAINQSQTANNVRLYSGEIRAWNGMQFTYTTGQTGIQSFYKLYNAVATASVWLTSSYLTDYAPGVLADSTDGRLYFTNSSGCYKTNYAMASSGPGPYPTSALQMGVPNPVAAPTVSSASSANPAEYRTYIYTYVSTFGSLVEESGPSPASAIVGVDVIGSTVVTVGGFSTAPTNGYNITGINIYRSVSGSTTASYEFVAYVPLATSFYYDTLTTLQLGQTCPTIGYYPPPTGMVGLINVGGQFLAGFVGNTVYFSAVGLAHAWPPAYAISFPYQIVGLSQTDGYIVVMTERFPYLISGTVPGSMTTQQLPNDEPCLSRFSIASNENGVVYASPNGLLSIGAGGAAIITNSLFRRDDWQAINPSYLHGLIYDNKYWGIFVASQTSQNSIIITPDDVPALSTITLNALAAYKDSITGNLYIVSAADNNIYQVDANTTSPLSYTWQSRRYVTPQAVALSALKIDANYAQITASQVYQQAIAASQAANTAVFNAGVLGGAVGAAAVNVRGVNGSLQASLPQPSGVLTLTLSLYGDGGVQIGSWLVSSFDPIRLPAYRAREMYFTLTGNINVTSVAMATTMRELDPVSIAQGMQQPTLWT